MTINKLSHGRWGFMPRTAAAWSLMGVACGAFGCAMESETDSDLAEDEVGVTAATLRSGEGAAARAVTTTLRAMLGGDSSCLTRTDKAQEPLAMAACRGDDSSGGRSGGGGKNKDRGGDRGGKGGGDSERGGAAAQKWSIEPAEAAGYFRISNAAGGDRRCIDIVNDGTNDRLTLAGCEYLQGQLWQIVDAERAGYRRMKTQFTGVERCLDVINNSQLRMTSCGDKSGQYWKVPVSSGGGGTTPSGSVDLAPGTRLRFEASDAGQSAHLEVVNRGTQDVTTTTVRARIAGQEVTGTLRSSSGAASIAPGASGFIDATLPANTLSRCNDYDVTVDVDRKVQSGSPDPFGNDTGRATTPCLRWNTPMTEDSLGFAPTAVQDGKSLQQIVSSEVIGRGDGSYCNKCHGTDSSYPYRAPSGVISPTQDLAGLTWAGNPGWVDRFVGIGIKPDDLMTAFQLWRQDGAR